MEQGFLSYALEWIVAYGAPMVGALLFLVQGGVPLPGTLIVLASGAFVAQGFLEATHAFPLALAGAVVGDSTLYWVGRGLRIPIVRRYGRTALWKRAMAAIRVHEGKAVFFTRWLLTPLGAPMSAVAGANAYSYGRFVALTLAGETIWITLYGSIGYVFSDAWEIVSTFVSDVSGLLVGLALVGAGAYLVLRRRAAR